MPNSRQTSDIGSPSMRRFTKRRRFSITQLAFHGIYTSGTWARGAIDWAGLAAAGVVANWTLSKPHRKLPHAGIDRCGTGPSIIRNRMLGRAIGVARRSQRLSGFKYARGRSTACALEIVLP